jgi:rhodanese-related sulfurtransferase
MLLTLGAICVAGLVLLISVRMKQMMEDRQIRQRIITAEALHELLLSNPEVLVFDVRLPIDLLVHTEMISGAKRISPEEIIENPSLIPKDKDSVIYCTCPDEKTSRAVIRRALGMNFFRMKLLKGGLEAWKAKGYPVEPYQKVFHLYTPNLAQFIEGGRRQS